MSHNLHQTYELCITDPRVSNVYIPTVGLAIGQMSGKECILLMKEGKKEREEERNK